MFHEHKCHLIVCPAFDFGLVQITLEKDNYSTVKKFCAWTQHYKPQYNMIQRDTIWYNMIKHGTTRYNTIKCNKTRYNMIEYNMIQHDTAWYNMIQHNITHCLPCVWFLVGTDNLREDNYSTVFCVCAWTQHNTPQYNVRLGKTNP